MDDFLKAFTGGAPGQPGQPDEDGGLGDLLGGLLGGGNLGTMAAAGVGAGVGSRMGGGMGALVGGSLGAMLPALIGMLGAKSPDGSTSGVHQLVDSADDRGVGDVARSWVSTGANQPISEEQVRQLLTPEQLAQLAATSGLSPDDVAKATAAVLPDVVSTLTPDGTIPQHDQVEATTSQMQSALQRLGASQSPQAAGNS